METCREVKPFERCLGHKSTTLVDGFMVLWKGLTEVGSLPSAFLSCEDTNAHLSRGQSSKIPSWNQKLNLLVPWAWISIPPKLREGKKSSALDKLPSLRHSVIGSPKRLSHHTKEYVSATGPLKNPTPWVISKIYAKKN